MTDLFAVNLLSLVATQGDAKVLLEQLRSVVAELPGGSPGTTLTIAGGAITPTRASHSIDTEGGAGADYLDTIAQANHGESRLLLLRGANAGRVVTVQHNIGGAGKILLTDGVPFVLNSTKKWLLLIRVGNTWEEVARFYGDKLEDMRAWLQLEPDTVSTALDRNITAADRGKVITLTGGTDRTFTFTATWAALGDGWSCYLKNASTAFLTILPAAGTIDGKAGLVLKPGEIVEVRSDGVNGDLIGGRLLWRERLTSNRTYYLSPTGNDANLGTAASPWATAQKAWETIHASLDLNGFTVYCQFADGNYTSGAIAGGMVPGQKGSANVVFQGNAGNAAAVVVTATGSDCFQATTRASFNVKDMELRTVTSGDCLRARSGGAIGFTNVRFGACAGYHIEAWGNASVGGSGAYSIVGGAVRHLFASSVGNIDITGCTVTVTGTPAFTHFARASNNGVIYAGGATFTGAATGTRYAAVQGGGIDTEAAGANFFPGSVAGAATAPGWYA